MNYDSSREQIFGKLLEKFDSLIRHAANRMSYPGKLDVEDQYNEGCLLLHEVLETTLNGGIYGFNDPFCDDFGKVFKTGLWWRLTSKINALKKACRDVSKESSPYMTDDEGSEFAVWDLDAEISDTYCSSRPFSNIQSQELVDEVKKLLPDNGKKLIDLFLDPTPLKDLISDYSANRARARLNKSIPLHIYRSYLGMKRFPFEDLMHKVRCAVATVVQQKKSVVVEAVVAEEPGFVFDSSETYLQEDEVSNEVYCMCAV